MRPVRTIRLLSTVITTAALVPIVFGTASASAVTPWHVASYLSRLSDDASQVACATTDVCWAVEGGRLIASGDGGTSWADRTDLIPPDAAKAGDVSCPTATRCYLTAVLETGAPAVYVIDSGALSTAAPTGAAVALDTLDCPGALLCFTSDGLNLYATNDGGTTWARRPLPETVDPAYVAVSCAPHTVQCWIVGRSPAMARALIYRTGDAGRHWTAQTVPDEAKYGLNAIDCPTSTTCYASGGWIIATTNGGDSWATTYRPTFSMNSLSCPSADTCMGVGYEYNWPVDLPGAPYAYRMTDGGAWSTIALTPAEANRVYADHAPAVSCPSEAQCTVVSDGAAMTSADQGSTWNLVRVPTQLRPTGYWSCPTLSHCVGIENQDWGHPVAIIGSPDGPWTSEPLPSDTATLRDVDCPTSRVCYAVATSYDTGLQILHSTDGGQTWRLKTVTMGTHLWADRLSCVTATTCFAYDTGSFAGHLHVTSNAGRTWREIREPYRTRSVSAIACASLTSCVLFTSRKREHLIWRTEDLGSTYTQLVNPGSTNDYEYDADCFGSTCLAVGLSGDVLAASSRVSTDSGATWTDPGVPAAAYHLYTVSCGSTTNCAAMGIDRTLQPVVVTTTDAATTWHVRALPSTVAPWNNSVSCVRNSCVAAANDIFGRPVVVTGSV